MLEYVTNVSEFKVSEFKVGLSVKTLWIVNKRFNI